ncbi:restriction endonuclease subunit S [Salmonella enterica]|uniref:restriction endonuclease subunit S n=1 Tax=Salmonella enterica TaxID=28901 RepID=UPI0009B09CA6|nr:restriction endonuclease subunit S [Salmonella enterica]ELL4732287.1 restriction endonuclease subunit S [Salmonella enterica]
MISISELVEKVDRINPNNKDGSWKYIDIASVDRFQKKIVLESVSDITSDSAPSRARQLVFAGDIIISTVRPNLNTVAIVPNELDGAIASTGFCVLRPNKLKVDAKYLFHYVKSEDFVNSLVKLATGANYPAVSDKIIKEQQFKKISLYEQKKISAILDKAEGVLRKREQSIKLIDDFLRATFLQMFGDPVVNEKKWPIKKLEEICDNVIDCPHSTPKWADNGTICIRTSNLSKGGWVWSDTRFVSESTYSERTKRSTVDEGDIILSREGTVGVAAIVPGNLKLCMGQRLVQLKLDKNQVISEYLLAFLLYELDPIRISRVMSGSTSKHINVSELKQLNVMLPSIKDQKLFSEIRNKIINISKKSNADSSLFEALSSALLS